MVREDIVSGLRNALIKGESIEQAKQSFINASYPSEEVEKAARFLTEKSESQLEELEPPKPTQQKTPTRKILWIAIGAIILILISVTVYYLFL